MELSLFAMEKPKSYANIGHDPSLMPHLLLLHRSLEKEMGTSLCSKTRTVFASVLLEGPGWSFTCKIISSKHLSFVFVIYVYIHFQTQVWIHHHWYFFSISLSTILLQRICMPYTRIPVPVPHCLYVYYPFLSTSDLPLPLHQGPLGQYLQHSAVNFICFK